MHQDPISLRLKKFFPALYAARSELPVDHYQLIRAPADTIVFDIGGTCEQYLLLTKGIVSVKMRTRAGRSLLLYHVNPGESCIITTSCLLGHSRYPTFGRATNNIEALGISSQRFSQALDQCRDFRHFVFDNLGQRLADVMQRLESVNFTSIDSRLATALLAREQRRVEITHEMLAEEIGTAREVVSRHLKILETRGLIKLERGAVSLVDTSVLEALCE